MNKEKLDIYHNLTSKDVLSSNFCFAGFFIATYEAIKNNICENIKTLYCVDSLYIRDGRIFSENNDDYKNEILNIKPDGKKNNTFFSSMLWLMDSGAIDRADYEFVTLTVVSKRNMYAHHSLELLCEKVSQSDCEILKRFLLIYRKINQWWGIEIEGNPEYAENCFVTLLVQTYNNLFGEIDEIQI